MCGRYASSASPDELAEEYEVDDIVGELPGADYNVAPTVEVPAILERASKESGDVRRRLTPLTWGLVPSWAKSRNTGAKMINARFETVAVKPAFKRACAVRRCLLPADGYYEWYEPQSPELVEGSGKRPSTSSGTKSTSSGTKSTSSGTKSTSSGTKSTGSGTRGRKQPFFIHRADGNRLAMAGLYEIWRDPDKDPDDDSAWLRTCTVITTQATDAVGHIHDRMPMVITPDRWDAWLDPKRTDPEAARDLLVVTEPAMLEAYAVSTLVSNVKNNGPELLEPLGEEPAPGEETLF